MNIKIVNNSNGTITLSSDVSVPFEGTKSFNRTYNGISVEACKRRFRKFVTQEVRNYIGIHGTEMWRNPTPYEIKFGEGAIHTQEFQTIDILTKDFKIKLWTVCPIDGLRYYRSRY